MTNHPNRSNRTYQWTDADGVTHTGERAEITSRRSYPEALSNQISEAVRHTGAAFLWSDDGATFQIKASRHSYDSAIKAANRIVKANT